MRLAVCDFERPIIVITGHVEVCNSWTEESLKLPEARGDAARR